MLISQLTLSHFRNHSLSSFNFTGEPVVFYGPNGAGKTNILEALSYFSAGRGLRGAALSDLTQYHIHNACAEQRKVDHGREPWSMSIVLSEMQNGTDTGNKTVPASNLRLSSQLLNDKRINKAQGEPVKSVTAFSEWLAVFWLTPEHDRLFTDASKVRRKFLDRMVYAFHPLHATHLVVYENAMKERLSILKQGYDDRWLSAIENKMATVAVEILFERYQVLQTLSKAALQLHDLFPKFTCVYKGQEESTIESKTKEEWQTWYIEQWRSCRRMDAEARMTHVGVHRSDFGVIHPHKGKGEDCSTGEQKILLMGLVLSFLHSRLQWDKKLVVILLDECVSHFDFSHRVVLFEQILKMQQDLRGENQLQVFMTGTDRSLFSALEERAQFFNITSATHHNAQEANIGDTNL